MNKEFFELITAKIFDYFKMKSPSIYAIFAATLVAISSVLTALVNNDVIKSGWVLAALPVITFIASIAGTRTSSILIEEETTNEKQP
jgi:hypothetical protein